MKKIDELPAANALPATFRLRVTTVDIKRLVLNAGGLVVFNVYTMHRTWITSEMSKPRYSLDIRLLA